MGFSRVLSQMRNPPCHRRCGYRTWNWFSISYRLSATFRRVDFRCTYQILPFGSFLRSFTTFWGKYSTAQLNGKGKRGSSWLTWLLASCAVDCWFDLGVLGASIHSFCVIHDIYGLYDCWKKIACLRARLLCRGARDNF